PAYRCSCPSRKFPCKHALALLLSWSRGAVPEAGTEGAPDFARGWQTGRAAPPARQKPKTPRDPEAAARRAQQRADRVSAGLAELETWLRDQVRAGLSTVAASGYRHAEAIAARMVGAPGPGGAGAVR